MDNDRADQIIELLKSIETSLAATEAMLDGLTIIALHVDSSTAATAYHTMPRLARWRASWHLASDVIRQTEEEGRAAQDGSG